MKALLLMPLFLITLSSVAQVTDNELVGDWEVIGTSLIRQLNTDTEQKQILEQLMHGLSKTRFSFKENGAFYITFPRNMPNFMKELEFLDDKKWRIGKQKNLIMVGSERDNFNLMRILFKKENGQLFFVLDDSPFLLKVRKE